MKITKLSASGLKGGNFSHDLGPVTAFVGPNFRGKTSRLEAIRLALMGYLPELGKTKSATMQLASGPTMRVDLEISEPYGDGLERLAQTIQRTWEVYGNAVSYSGGDPVVPDVLLDPQVYFSLGAKDRVRYVFSRAQINAPEAAADAIISKVKQIKIDGHAPAHEQAINSVVETVDDSDRARHDAGQSVQEWVEKLIADMRDRLKVTKQNADRMSKTVQGLAQVKATEDEGVMQNTERQLKEISSKWGEMSRKQGVISEQLKQARIDRLVREQTEEKLANTKDQSEEIARLEKQLSDAMAKVEPVVDLGKLYDDFHLMNRTQAAAKAKLEAVNEEVKKLDKKHEQDMAADKCPHCGARSRGWKKHIETAYAERRYELTQWQATALAEFSKWSSMVAAQQEKINAAKEIDSKNQANRKAQLEISAVLHRLYNAQQAVTLAKSKLETLRVVTTLEINDMVGTLAALDIEMKALSESSTELHAKHKAWVQAKQDEKRNAQALLQHQETLAEVAVLKETVAILEALQVEMVRQAFGTILDRANKVVGGILKHNLEYRDGEIGWQDGTTWVGHQTFSGSEKALCYAGISAALAWDSPIKIILLDEISRFDDQNGTALIQHFVKLVEEGNIHQVVVAGLKLPSVFDAMQGVTVVNV